MNRQQWTGRRKHKPGYGLNGRTAILLIISGLLVFVGLFQLISSFVGQKASEKTDEEMRALYHTEEADPTPTSVPTAAPPPAPIAMPEEKPSPDTIDVQAEENAAVVPEQTDPPTPSPVPRLAEQDYLGNPGRNIGSRFQKLRKENQDIIGWLKIGTMVDEAVVQRDNEYYMNHNVKKEPDVSGAIFLDELVQLKTRPYALILYGHNMKTGARFGSLRNFENRSFFRRYPFISFDTLYEEGKYVVFSVGTVSTMEGSPHYLDFFALNSRRVDERQQALDVLQDVSIHSNGVDVALDDQILLLVTCVEQDEDRRIVAARRLREDETEESLVIGR